MTSELLAYMEVGVRHVLDRHALEIGQVAVLLAVGLVLLGLDRVLTLLRPSAARAAAAGPVRFRAVAISAAAGVVAVVWAAERAPW